MPPTKGDCLIIGDSGMRFACLLESLADVIGGKFRRYHHSNNKSGSHWTEIGGVVEAMEWEFEDATTTRIFANVAEGHPIIPLLQAEGIEVETFTATEPMFIPHPLFEKGLEQYGDKNPWSEPVVNYKYNTIVLCGEINGKKFRTNQECWIGNDGKIVWKGCYFTALPYEA